MDAARPHQMRLWRHLDRHTSGSSFDSSHQHRALSVVCAIECRQQLPAFRREPRDIGVWDVAELLFGGIRWLDPSRALGDDNGVRISHALQRAARLGVSPTMPRTGCQGSATNYQTLIPRPFPSNAGAAI
jgi:hypothetical protein